MRLSDLRNLIGLTQDPGLDEIEYENDGTVFKVRCPSHLLATVDLAQPERDLDTSSSKSQTYFIKCSIEWFRAANLAELELRTGSVSILLRRDSALCNVGSLDGYHGTTGTSTFSQSIAAPLAGEFVAVDVTPSYHPVLCDELVSRGQLLGSIKLDLASVELSSPISGILRFIPLSGTMLSRGDTVAVVEPAR